MGEAFAYEKIVTRHIGLTESALRRMMENRDRHSGHGTVGSTAASALMLRALFGEIVLIDSGPSLARAKAADISDANALARPTRVWAGDFSDAFSARNEDKKMRRHQCMILRGHG